MSAVESPIHVRRLKVAAYLAAGGREVWLVSDDGSLEIIDGRGRRSESAFGIRLVPPKL